MFKLARNTCSSILNLHILQDVLHTEPRDGSMPPALLVSPTNPHPAPNSLQAITSSNAQKYIGVMLFVQHPSYLSQDCSRHLLEYL